MPGIGAVQHGAGLLVAGAVDRTAGGEAAEGDTEPAQGAEHDGVAADGATDPAGQPPGEQEGDAAEQAARDAPGHAEDRHARAIPARRAGRPWWCRNTYSRPGWPSAVSPAAMTVATMRPLVRAS